MYNTVFKFATARYLYIDVFCVYRVFAIFPILFYFYFSCKFYRIFVMYVLVLVKRVQNKIFIKAKTSLFFYMSIYTPWKLTCCLIMVVKFAFIMLCIFTCWLITSTLCCWRCVHNHSVAWDDGSIRNGQPALWVKNKDNGLKFGVSEWNMHNKLAKMELRTNCGTNSKQ